MQTIESDLYRYDFNLDPVMDDVYLVIRSETTTHWGDEPEYPYHCELWGISPNRYCSESLESILDANGISLEEYEQFPLEGKIEFLASNSAGCYFWQQSGHSLQKLLSHAGRELLIVREDPVSRMATRQNAMGSTAAEWLSGSY